MTDEKETVFCDNCGKPITDWRLHADQPMESGYCPCHPQGAVITRPVASESIPMDLTGNFGKPNPSGV
jgi:hypothetical protein